MLIVLAGAAVAAQTTIEWWQFWTDPEIKPTIAAMVDDFEKANPDIKVTLSDLTWADGHAKIAMALASGTGPDVLELGSDWIAQFAAAGRLADLTEEMTPEKAQFQGWGLANYSDHIYAKPWILGTRVLFCNRALLIQAGYPADFVPITLDQLWEAALKIRKLGKNVYGWGSNTPEKHRLYKKFLPFFWTAGAQLFSDDGKYCVLASDKAIGALRFYKMLNDSCGYVADQRGIEDAFLDGKVGFVMSGDWLLKRIQVEKRDIDFFTTLFPGSAFPGKSFLGGEFLAVSAASPRKEAALKLIDFITSPENQVRFCKANRSANPSSIAAQQDAFFAADPNLQTFIKQIFSAKYPPVDPDWVYIEEAIEGAVEDALFGSKQVAQPLYDAEKKIDRLKRKE
jgi:multiple sugar transport system substrate-binding protein